MSDDALSLLWTYGPLVASGSAFVLSLVMRRDKALIAGIVVVNAICAYCYDHAVNGLDSNDAYGFLVPVGFAIIDYTCGVLALAAGEAAIAVAFGLSVLNGAIFCIHMRLAPTPVTPAELLTQYHDRMTYGWIAFALSILPSLILTGGSFNGRGGNRYRRMGHHLSDDGGGRLSAGQGG